MSRADLAPRCDLGFEGFERGVQGVQVLDGFGPEESAEGGAAAVELGTKRVGWNGGRLSGGEAGHVGVDGGLDGGGFRKCGKDFVGALVGPARGGGDFLRREGW